MVETVAGIRWCVCCPQNAAQRKSPEDSKDDAVQGEAWHSCCRDIAGEEITIDVHASPAAALDLPARRSRADVWRDARSLTDRFIYRLNLS